MSKSTNRLKLIPIYTMANTLVTYYTQTGNTEKIARAIFRSLPGKKELIQLSEVDNTDSYQLIFIGFPIYSFEPPGLVKEFILNHLEGKNIVIFITMSLTTAPASEEITELYNLTINNCKFCAERTKVIGLFDCPGELSEKTAQGLLKSTDSQLRTFGMLRDLSLGFPNEKNMADAEKFAKKVFIKYYEKKGNVLNL